MRCATEYESPLGRLTLASDGVAVCGLWMEGQKRHGAGLPGDPALVRDDAAPGFDALRRWLDAYFAGERPSVADVPLSLHGSAFRRAVWRILVEIPYGSTTTYGAVADRVRSELGAASPLAVGGAVGRNPVSLVVPCHRVVGADGSLTGYAGGLERKAWLLRHEGVEVDASRMRVGACGGKSAG